MQNFKSNINQDSKLLYSKKSYIEPVVRFPDRKRYGESLPTTYEVGSFILKEKDEVTMTVPNGLVSNLEKEIMYHFLEIKPFPMPLLRDAITESWRQAYVKLDPGFEKGSLEISKQM